VALVAQTVAGSGNGLDNVAVDTLVQRTVPRRRMGRVFGVVSTAALLGGATARGLGGIVVDLTSVRTTFVIGGVGVLVSTAVAGVMLARAGWGAEPEG
jgi:MFS family permease